jgi:hypothetical protein
MDATPKTNQELVLQLLHKLIDLQVELAAMTSVLKSSLIQEQQTGKQIDWQKAVAHHRDSIRSSNPVALYSDIERRLLSSNLESPEAILLMIELANRSIEA